MTKQLKYKDSAFIEATGKTWKEWLSELEKMNAKNLNHKDIVFALVRQYDISDWWAQSITVRFEQETGRRIPGETSEGTYQVTVSSTIEGDAETIFDSWTEKYALHLSFNGVKIAAPPTTSITKKWYYWRVKLENASRISVNFSQKTETKTLVQVNHDDILSSDEIEQWKAFWKKEIAGLF
ncbi:MAG TPA: hypothetical protein VN958_09150 [Chitinophagaceae bacterium]|nr:hypothetical protein [Chitinophagaceae bacterium]